MVSPGTSPMPPVTTLPTSPPAWHSTTLSTLLQRMVVGVLVLPVWGVDRPAGDDRVEDAVRDLVGGLFEAGRIAPLARISDSLPHRRGQQPGTRDHRRQRLECHRLLGVQLSERL